MCRIFSAPVLPSADELYTWRNYFSFLPLRLWVFEICVLRRLEKIRNVEVHIPFYTRVFQMDVFQVFPTKFLYAFLFSPYVPYAPTHLMPDWSHY